MLPAYNVKGSKEKEHFPQAHLSQYGRAVVVVWTLYCHKVTCFFVFSAGKQTSKQVTEY